MKLKYLALIGLLPFAINSHAADFSYNIIETSLGAVQPDDDEIENGTGIKFAGSLELGSVAYIAASASVVKFDVFDQSINTLGVGIHTSILEKTDVYGQIHALQAEIDVENESSIDDSGQGAILGLRHMTTSNIELNVGAEYSDVFDETDTAPFIGVYYYNSEEISIGFTFSTPEDANVFQISLRATL